jgi:hypothetical protein
MGGPVFATIVCSRRLLRFRHMGLIVLSHGTSACGERAA